MQRCLFRLDMASFCCAVAASGGATPPLRHDWQFNGIEYTWQTEVVRSNLDSYRSRPRPKTNACSVYATDPVDDQYISEIEVFRRAARDHGLDPCSCRSTWRWG
jgi:hypothetical protein